MRISGEGVVTVLAKHFEAGQGAYTGLATLVAEELDADWRQIRVEGAPADERLYNNLLFGPIQQSDFNTDRLLRCDHMPQVEVHLVPSMEKPTGVGEPGVPPIAPAVVDALSATTGRRFWHLPFAVMSQ